MEIKVLGSGCKTCKNLYETVLTVVGDSEKITVEYITEMSALLEAGIMGSPALLIDEKVVSVGRVPSSDEINEYIEKMSNDSEDSSAGCSCGGTC